MKDDLKCNAAFLALEKPTSVHLISRGGQDSGQSLTMNEERIESKLWRVSAGMGGMQMR